MSQPHAIRNTGDQQLPTSLQSHDAKGKDSIRELAMTEHHSHEGKAIGRRKMHATNKLAFVEQRIPLLQEGQEWAGIIARNMVDGVIAADKKWAVTFMNTVAETLTGFKEEEALGRLLTDIFISKRQPDSSDGAPQMDGDGWGDTTRSVILISKDGSQTHIEFNMSLMRDSQEMIRGYAVVFRDITARKKTEERLQEVNKVTGMRGVVEGTAHNFNNIMAIILANSYVLDHTDVMSEKCSQSIVAIKEAARHGARLVKNLFMAAQETISWSETVNIRNSLKDLHETLKQRLPETITLNMHLPGRLPEVLGDQRQLSHAFLNLALNARDAMPDGGVLSVIASVISESQMRERFPSARATQYVCIAVADTGVGIDTVTQQRIFEPFFTTKGPDKADGLGLAVVHGIVNSHGGFVTLNSQLDRGTIAVVYLPVRPANDALRQGSTKSGEPDERISVPN